MNILIVLLVAILLLGYRLTFIVLALLTYPVWGLPIDLYILYKENKKNEKFYKKY